jgi:hypothetical protein
MWNNFFKPKNSEPQSQLQKIVKELEVLENRKVNSLQELQDWRKGMDKKLQEIKEEKERQSIIAFSEYQVKDFANWCMREVIDDNNILYKWIQNGPDFLFQEWKKSRKL